MAFSDDVVIGSSDSESNVIDCEFRLILGVETGTYGEASSDTVTGAVTFKSASAVDGWGRLVTEQYRAPYTGLRNHAVVAMGVIAGASNFAAQVTASANMIIINLGTNDDNAANMATHQAAVEAGIVALKASNPRASIYWMNVLPRYDGTDKGNIRTANAAGCTAQGIPCWDTTTDPWFDEADTNTPTDKIHQLMSGHIKIATRVMGLLA